MIMRGMLTQHHYECCKKEIKPNGNSSFEFALSSYEPRQQKTDVDCLRKYGDMNQLKCISCEISQATKLLQTIKNFHK